MKYSRNSGARRLTPLTSLVIGADSIPRGPLITGPSLGCVLAPMLPKTAFLGDVQSLPCANNFHVGSPLPAPTAPFGSWFIRDAVAALPGWEATFNPVAWLMMVGINDLQVGTPAATVASDLRTFRASRPNIVMCGITKVFDPVLQAAVDATNRLFEPDCRTDLVTVTWIDGVHPDAASMLLFGEPCRAGLLARNFASI